jgi:hypothetical protein
VFWCIASRLSDKDQALSPNGILVLAYNRHAAAKSGAFVA